MVVKLGQAEKIRNNVQSVASKVRQKRPGHCKGVHIRRCVIYPVFKGRLVNKANVKACVVGGKGPVSNELQKPAHRLFLTGSAFNVFVGNTGKLGYVQGYVALGVNKGLEAVYLLTVF